MHTINLVKGNINEEGKSDFRWKNVVLKNKILMEISKNVKKQEKTLPLLNIENNKSGISKTSLDKQEVR